MQFELMKGLLEANAERIRLLVEGIGVEQSRWRPEPGEWSALEVVNHLLDEEREDFRVRLDIILHKPGEKWPPIDPQGWVTARNYNDRNLATSLAEFLAERQKSLAWLETLSEPDWDAADEAPWGAMRAGDMFASWVTHDQLHMRQLLELQRAYLQQMVGPYDLTYAGPW